MSSSRALLCDLCILLLVGLTLGLPEDRPHTSSPAVAPVKTNPAEVANKGNCSCGGFPTSKIEAKDLPMLSQTPGLLVKCDAEGETTCKNLCNALAIATKAKGPEVLCLRLKTVNELRLSAFYKVCDLPWTYANLTAEETLCCEEAKVKICPSMEKLVKIEKVEKLEKVEKNNATETIDAKTVM